MITFDFILFSATIVMLALALIWLSHQVESNTARIEKLEKEKPPI